MEVAVSVLGCTLVLALVLSFSLLTVTFTMSWLNMLEGCWTFFPLTVLGSDGRSSSSAERVEGTSSPPSLYQQVLQQQAATLTPQKTRKR